MKNVDQYAPRAGRIAHQKLPRQYKTVSATILDKHLRGMYIRSMLGAQRAYEQFKKKSSKEKGKDTE